MWSLSEFKFKTIHLSLSVLFLVSLQQVGMAQTFDDALDLYEQGSYQEAAELFEQLTSQEATLFAGKSYYALGQYVRSKTFLLSLNEEAPQALQREALYTLALVHFQLKEFGAALNGLYELSNERPRTPLINDSIQLYKDILNYLTTAQRKKAYQEARYPEIRYDLINSAFGKVPYGTAKILLHQYRRTSLISDDSTRFQELEEMIADSLNYAYQVSFGDPLKAPKGTVYNIGAALPEFDTTVTEFTVSQGLYFGYLLAAEEFNQRNTDRKAFIRFENTGADLDSAGYAITDFAWNYSVDAILGPLFSEPAQQMAELAEQYQIPLLAPLANSDSLNLDNPYVYQANPTFASHGRRMAEFAVKRLDMDTLAVLTERNSLGAASAYAFRREAERLGASIPYFFVEDLESQGYEVTEYTKYFTTDSTVIDSLGYHHLDGIYAPFTGQVAPTLIDLLMIDIEAMDSDLTIFGSPEWGATEIPEERLEGRTIYFSESFYINSKSERVNQFEEDYRTRFGLEPSRYSMIGYDSASFLLRTLERIENPSLLKNALKHQPLYEGLISNIKFEGTHVNQQVKIFKISDQGIQPAIY